MACSYGMEIGVLVEGHKGSGKILGSLGLLALHDE